MYFSSLNVVSPGRATFSTTMKANTSAKARIRKQPNGIYHSHIYLLGTWHRKSANTRNRQAALEFNFIHLKHLLKNGH